MQNVKHHLTDPLLMAYSAGSLPEAFSLVVAAHVSMCDECRARLESFDCVGGALLNGTGSADLNEDCLDATLRLIRSGTVAAPPVSRQTARKSALPAPVLDYLGGDLDRVRWRPIGQGVKQAILPTSKAATARLLHIPAGGAVPAHSHRGLELTLVLQGAYSDESDHFARGDIEIAGEELNHRPTAAPGEDCICLAATDAPLRFNSLLTRIAQPFLRI